jgi:CDP-6-deoxy-D-xylo-4-hexulose-3-dehydrase
MGVGGGVFSNSKEIMEKVRQYRDWGRQANTTQAHKVKELPKDYNPRFVYDKIGYNFQILELQAAMGRVQLRKSNKIKNLRQRNFDYLYWNLDGVGDLVMPKWVEGADVCWFAFPLSTKGDRGKLVAYLEKNGIETRSMFSGDITRHPAYKHSSYKVYGKLKEADYILKHSFWITCHPRLKRSDLDYIIKTFKDYYASTA